jgi:hypothetical protein
VKLKDQVIIHRTRKRVKEGKEIEGSASIKESYSNVAYEQHHIATKNLVSPEVLRFTVKLATLLGFAPDGPPLLGITYYLICYVIHCLLNRYGVTAQPLFTCIPRYLRGVVTS